MKHSLVSILLIVGFSLAVTACKVAEHAASDASQYAASGDSFVVKKTEYSKKVREHMQTGYKETLALANSKQSDECPLLDGYINTIVTRLVSSSRLNQAIRQAPPMTVRVQCKVRSVTSPTMKAAVLNIYPMTLLAFRSEDQIAAMLAHELIHYTRSHDENILKIHYSWLTFNKKSAIQKAKNAHEYEADRLSLVLLNNAGYDPNSAFDGLQRIVDYEPTYKQLWGPDVRDLKFRKNEIVKTLKAKGWLTAAGSLADQETKSLVAIHEEINSLSTR